MIDSINFAWPGDSMPRVWTLRNTSKLQNLASDYLDGSGLYVFHFDPDVKHARMSLVSSQVDASSVTKYIIFKFQGTGPSGLTGAMVSATRAASRDLVTAATWHTERILTFFFVELQDDQLLLNQRMLIEITNSSVLALKTENDRQALCVIFSAVDNVIQLWKVDFINMTYNAKSGTQTSSTIIDPRAKFVTQGFYMSGIIQQSGFSKHTGILFSSNQARRLTRMLPSAFLPPIDWTTATCMEPPCISLEDVSVIQSQLTHEIQYYPMATEVTSYVSNEYVQQKFDALDSGSSRTVRINLRPQGDLVEFSSIVTYGMRIEMPIPKVEDVEGDLIGKSFKNLQNPQLPIYEILKFDPNASQEIPHIQSDVLTRDNCVIGPSFILMQWTDMNTGQILTHVGKVDIMDERDWYLAYQNGQVRADGLSGGGSTDKELSFDGSYNEQIEAEPCADANASLKARKAFKLDAKPTYKDVLDRFESVYGTADNFMKSYGGKVKIGDEKEEQKLDESGEVGIKFSRPIVFPRQLLSDFDPTYQENVPVLEISEQDKEAIEAEYQELKRGHEDRKTQAKVAIQIAEAQLATCKASLKEGEDMEVDNGVSKSDSQDGGSSSKSGGKKSGGSKSGGSSGSSKSGDSSGGSKSDKSGGSSSGSKSDKSGGSSDGSSSGSKSGGSSSSSGSSGRSGKSGEKGSGGKGGSGKKGRGLRSDLRALESTPTENWQRKPDLSLSLEQRISVEIIDEGGYEDEYESMMQDFDWSLTKASAESISVQLNFKNPRVYDGNQNVVIKAKFSDFEPGWNDDDALVTIEIPKQKIQYSEVTKQTVASAASTTQIATAATLGANILMSGAMSQIWSMINGLQIIVNLPLFMAQFPQLSFVIIEALIAIATFDLFPTDEIYTATISPPDDEEQESEKFEEIGYESNSMILNLGTLFLVLVLLLAWPCFLICTIPCKGLCSCFKNKHESSSQSFKGNAYIRYILEGFLDIAICASLNYKASRKEDSGGLLQWETTFGVINSSALLLLGLSVMVFPSFVLWFYCKNFSKWEQEQFQERYGAVLEGLRLDKRSSLGYAMIFMFRRFALVLIVIVFSKQLVVQVTVMVLCSSIQIGYLMSYKPIEEPLPLKLDVVNEVTTVILVDILCLFSDANPADWELEGDIFFLALLFGNLSIHLYFLIRNTIRGTKACCRRCNQKCCGKKEQDQKEKKVANSKKQAKLHTDYVQTEAQEGAGVICSNTFVLADASAAKQLDSIPEAAAESDRDIEKKPITVREIHESKVMSQPFEDPAEQPVDDEVFNQPEQLDSQSRLKVAIDAVSVLSISRDEEEDMELALQSELNRIDNDPVMLKSPTKEEIDDMFGGFTQVIKNKTNSDLNKGRRNAGMVTGITKASQ